MKTTYEFSIVVTARDRTVVERIKQAVIQAAVDTKDATIGVESFHFQETSFRGKPHQGRSF